MGYMKVGKKSRESQSRERKPDLSSYMAPTHSQRSKIKNQGCKTQRDEDVSFDTRKFLKDLKRKAVQKPQPKPKKKKKVQPKPQANLFKTMPGPESIAQLSKCVTLIIRHCFDDVTII